MCCYVCRKQIRGYENHLDDRQPNPEGKYPQHSETDKMHDEDIVRSAEQANAGLAKSNPNIRVDQVINLGLLAHESKGEADGGFIMFLYIKYENNLLYAFLVICRQSTS